MESWRWWGLDAGQRNELLKWKCLFLGLRHCTRCPMSLKLLPDWGKAYKDGKTTKELKFSLAAEHGSGEGWGEQKLLWLMAWLSGEEGGVSPEDGVWWSTCDSRESKTDADIPWLPSIPRGWGAPRAWCSGGPLSGPLSEAESISCCRSPSNTRRVVPVSTVIHISVSQPCFLANRLLSHFTTNILGSASHLSASITFLPSLISKYQCRSLSDDFHASFLS